MALIVHQTGYFIFRSESTQQLVLVLVYPPDKVICHTGVERPSCTGHDVDEVGSHSDLQHKTSLSLYSFYISKLLLDFLEARIEFSRSLEWISPLRNLAG